MNAEINKKNNSNSNNSNRNKKYRANKNNNNKRRNNSNQNKQRFQVRLAPSEKVYKDWQDLVNRQILARKKYYDAFGSDNVKHVNKLRNIYESLLADLAKFDHNIPEQLKDKFSTLKFKFNEDNDYSKNMGENIIGAEEQAEIDKTVINPHLLESQINSDFSDDSQESSGTMDDYNAYKGI